MRFSYAKMVWKGLRPALTAGLVAGAAGFAFSVDPATLQQLGVPTLLSVVVVEAARNFFKQRDLRQ